MVGSVHRRIRDIEDDRVHVPIIGMTGQANVAITKFEVGMDDLVSKPITFDDLRDLVELWLENQ